jgi:hypothetical protein
MTDDSNDEPEANGKLKRREYEQQLARLTRGMLSSLFECVQLMRT